MPDQASLTGTWRRFGAAAFVAAACVTVAWLAACPPSAAALPAPAAASGSLVVVKTAETGPSGPGLVYNGDTITYSVSITNTSGADSASAILIVDALPQDTLDNIQCADSCEPLFETMVFPEPTGGTVVVTITRQISWTVPLLAPGASTQRSFSARVIGQSDGTAFSNRAFVTYQQGGATRQGSSNEVSTTVRVRIGQTGEASLSTVPTWFSADMGGTISQDWGDFDRDGDLDLALASAVGLSVYRNDGGRLNKLWGNSRQTYGVAWGDYSGDGKLELAAVGGSTDGTPATEGINYIYSRSGAEFVQTGVFTSDNQLVRIVAGDFRGLGTIDLVASTNAINSACPVRLYRNDGAGAFGTTTADCISTWASAALGAADVDNNGTLDLALGLFPHRIEVRLNDGTGAFPTAMPLDGYLSFLPYDFSWGDYDADGFLDLAAAFPMQREARVYRNLSGAGFGRPVVIHTGLFWTPLTVDWADFHGEGSLDLVVGDAPPSIYRWNGSTFDLTSELAPDSVTGRIWSMRSVRLVPDGDLTLAVSNRDGPSLLFDGVAGRLKTAITPVDAVRASSVAWGDANGDGALDLALGAGSPPAVGARVYYNLRGELTSTNKLSLVSSGLGPHSLAFGDPNRSGDLELAVGTAGENQVYPAGETAASWTSALPAATNHVVAWGDADNNGTLDLVSSGRGGPLALFLSRGGILSPTPDYTSPFTGNVTSLAWCDLDRDGFPDVVTGNAGEPSQAFHNNRNGALSFVWASGLSSNTASIACADYNGDSYPDVVLGNDGEPSTIFENVGGQLQPTPIWSSPTTRRTKSVAWGDWNNDGYPELAIGNLGERDQVYTNLNSSPGSPRLFWAWTSDEVQDTTGVAWGDVNGDGFLDLAISQDGSGSSGVYHNTSVAPSHFGDVFTPTLLLPNNASYVWLPRPGATDDGYLYSSSEILSGPGEPTVTVRYRVYNADGTRVTAGSNATGTELAATVFEFSLDGGSTWSRATRAAGSRDAITTTSRLGQEGVFYWDAVADQAISDDARFRVRVIDQDRAGPVQRSSTAAVSPPFRVRGTTCIWPENPRIYTYPENPPTNTVAYFIGALDTGSGALVFSWDFGDGSPIEFGQSVNHVFAIAGYYTVTLTVTGEPCPTNRERVVSSVVPIGVLPPVYKLYFPTITNQADITGTSPTTATAAAASGVRRRAASPVPEISQATPAIGVTAGRPADAMPAVPPPAADIAAPGAPCSVTQVSAPVIGINDQPAQNAGGRRVVFWSTADYVGKNWDGSIEVFTADLDASGHITYTQVTSSAGSVLGGFNFSPSSDLSGQRIAFFTERDLTGGNPDGNFEIYLAELASGGAVTITQLTTTTIGASILPSISDSGSRIAFASDRNLTTKNPDANSEIVLIELDSSKNITYTVVTKTTGGFNDEPSMSGDGKRVAFVSDRDLTGGNPEGWPQIFLAVLDGSIPGGFVQVTTGDGGGVGRPAISADGRRIAFASERNLTGQNAAGTMQVFLAEVDGAGGVALRQLTSPEQGTFDQPAVNGDGTRIAFVSLADESIQLFDTVINAVFQLTVAGSNSYSPSIDRAGVNVSFTAQRGVYASSCPLVDLELTKISQPPSALVGEGLAYTLIITNHGPSVAGGIRLADVLAPELLEVVPPDQVDDDNSASGFGGGTFDGTRWSTTASALELAVPAEPLAYPLPDNRANTWVNMAGNALLLHLNEAAGSRTFSDTSGLGNPAACQPSSCPTAGAGGKLGTALAFDGIKTFASVPYTGGLNFEGRITIAAWVNSASRTGIRNILAHGPSGSPSREVHLRINEGFYEIGSLYFGASHQARWPIPAGDLGSWVHLAGVHDGRSWRIYRNGLLLAVTDDAIGAVSMSSPWALGAAGDGASRFFSGLLDEVAVFSRDLTSDEILEIYNRQARLYSGFSGSFTSRQMDARAALPWQTLSWTPALPMGKQLPDNGLAETGYPGSMANMSGNTLLLHFAEPAGSTIFTDTSGSNRTGTCLAGACPTAAAAGKLGRGLRFDGTNDVLTVLDPPNPTNYTIELWVRTASSSAGSVIARTGAAGPLASWSHQLRITSSGRFEHYLSDGSRRSVVGTTLIVPGLWYHLAGVATSNGVMRLYVNGQEEGAAVAIGNLWVGGDRWVIGSNSGDAMGFLNGSVDEVAIFNRVLTAQEIRDHYRRGAMQARYQVRTCSTSDCSQPGESFIGPDGTASTYYSELANATMGLPSASLTALDNRYFQYRLLLDTDNLTSVPQVLRIAVAPSHESVSASQGSCTGTRDLACELGTLQPGSTATVTIVSQLSSEARGRVINTANISSDETERDLSDNTASATTPILSDTDLSITQTVGAPSAVAGMPYSYTLWVSNSGPEPATAVQVYDRLPEGASLTSAPSSCTLDGSLLVCAVGGMPAATTQHLFVTVDLRPETRGVITNAVSVGSAETDPFTGNNAFDQASPVVAFADLSVVASAADEVLAGAVLTYTLQIANWGPSTAMSVTVTDSLPLSATEVATSSVPFSRTGDLISWDLGTISPTGEVSLTLAVTVSGSARTAISNTVGVSSAETDPDLTDNTFVRDTLVNAEVDLVLTKSGTPAVGTAGAPLTYTLVLTNSGPSDAFDVVLTDTIPASLTVGYVGPPEAGCTPAGSTVNCALATVQARQTISIVIATAVERKVQAGTITNTAGVTTTTRDVDQLNNTADLPTYVRTMADLAVYKSGPASAMAGADIGYTIVVTNYGPSDATQVFLTDTIPATLTVAAASPGCSVAASYVTCDLGTMSDLAGFNTREITLTARVAAAAAEGEILANSATARGREDDDFTSNDTGISAALVQRLADLSLIKTASTEPVLAGDMLTYTLAVANAGPSDASSVRVTDTLPSDVVFAEAMGCGQAGGVVTCTVAAIPAGGSQPVTIVVTVPSGTAEGTLLWNQASVTGTETDPDGSDNASSITTTVHTRADLELNKSASSGTVLAGNNLTYTLVLTNHGPSDSIGVVLTDALPAGVVVAASPPGWALAGGNLTGTLGTVSAQETRAFTIVVQVPSSTATGTVLVNSARAAGGTEDLGPGSALSLVSTPVDTQADLTISKSVAPDPVFVGNPLTYTLAMTNIGPSDAINTIVTDLLPSGVTFVSASASSGTCQAGGGLVTCTLGSHVDGRNLLINPDAEAGTLAGWILLANGGTGWTVTSSAAQQGTQSFQTSLVWNTRAQEIDLLAAGLSAVYLDMAPVVSLEEWYAAIGLEPDEYYLSAELRRADHSALATWSAGSSAAPLPAAAAWTQVSNAFAGYGPGARYIYFEDGGRAAGGASDTAGAALDAARAAVASRAAPPGIYTITIHADVTAGTGGTLTNTTRVSSETADPDPANSFTQVTSLAATNANLAITKSVSAATAAAGEHLTYTINLTNPSALLVSSVMVTDTLPAAAIFGSASAECEHAAGTLRCAVGQMAGGESRLLTATVQIDPTAPAGDLVNSVIVASDTNIDPEPANNSDQASTAVYRNADLAVSKSHSPETVMQRQSIYYTLSITNVGPSTAQSTVVTDTLPVELQAVSATPSQGACGTGVTFTCSLGNMAPGAEARVWVSATVEAGARWLTNTVSVGSADPDSDTSDNSVTLPVTVKQADLAISKAESDDPAYAGTWLTYTLMITNAGPRDATGVTVTDTLPANVTFGSASTECTLSGGAVVCNVGSLTSTAALNTRAITVAVQVASSAAHGSQIVNSAVVAALETDPNTGDNEASASTTAERRADLSLTKTASTDPVIAGAVLTYTLTAANQGPDDASGVTITDTLAQTVTFKSASAVCTPAGAQVVCSIGSISTGNSQAVTVAVTVPAAAADGGTVPNSAIVHGHETDLDPADNTAAIDTGLIRRADLAVAKAPPPAPVVAGSEVTFTLSVTNLGRSLATGITVTDTLPASTTFVAASGSPVQAGSQVTWTLSQLAPNAAATYSVRVTIDDVATGPITNTARAWAVEIDPVPGNNLGTATATVVGLADLSVIKSVAPETVVQNQSVTYVVTVTNSGPGVATGVRLTDTLPNDVQNPSHTVSQGACSGTTTIVCQVGSLADNDLATLTITGTVKPGAQSLTNIATTTADQSDNVSNNNTFTLTTNAKQSDLLVSKSASPSPATAGGSVTYTFVLTNGGPDNATGVVLHDNVAAGMTFQSASPGCSFASGTITCSVGDVSKQNNNNTKSLTATLGIPSTAPHGSTWSDTASVDGVETDPDPSNNAFTLATTANRSADLNLTKAPSSSTVTTGGSVSYTLAVTNAGPSEASSVTLTDTLPVSITAAYATGSPIVSGRSLTWTLGTMPPGAVVTRTVTITVDAAARGTLTNTTGAYAAEYDPTAPNFSSVPVMVATAAPQSVTVSGPLTGTSGTSSTFSATVNITASLPITYVWEIGPAATITHAARYAQTDSLSLTWSVTGSTSITVTAVNAAGGLNGTLETNFGLITPAGAAAEGREAEHHLFLPLVLRMQFN